jgi:ribonuclease HII
MINAMIVGIDEVGRGAWAGPMAVGAVILGGAEIDGLTDSKKLTKKQREALDQEIRQKALAIGIGWVSARDIDAIGLTAALKLASRRALSHIRHDYKEIIIDGNVKFIDDPRVSTLPKADLLVPSVSAASIVAKVARDKYMKHLDMVFPGYSFASHVGYGTPTHRRLIADIGVSPIHRLSYAPLQKHMQSDKVTTKRIGDRAEAEAARHLKKRGHRIIARNWKTKYCEIDIVSYYNETLYFTEVKYRRTDKQGDGLAAITSKKQSQMAFAAELFVTQQKYTGMNMILAAASVTGTPPQVQSFLEIA